MKHTPASLLDALHPKRNAAIISLSYLVAGSSYILFSSWLAKVASYDVGQLARFEIIKGLAFIAITAALLYLLTRYLFWLSSKSVQTLVEIDSVMTSQEHREKLSELLDRVEKLTENHPILTGNPDLLKIQKELKDLTGDFRKPRSS